MEELKQSPLGQIDMPERVLIWFSVTFPSMHPTSYELATLPTSAPGRAGCRKVTLHHGRDSSKDPWILDSEVMDTQMFIDCLDKARSTRGKVLMSDTIFHSDYAEVFIKPRNLNFPWT